MTLEKIADAEQIRTLSELAGRIWREYFVTLITPAQIEYMLDRFLSPAALARAIGAEGYDYRIARGEDGAAVGFFGARQEQDALFLSKLYVSAAARGQGYAGEMLRFLIGAYRPRGVGAIRLTCHKRNAPALAVYRHWGFAVTGSVETDIGGGFVMDDYLMTLSL